MMRPVGIGWFGGVGCGAAAQVIVLSFGQDFPDTGADIARQMFSVGVAGIGLAGFALVLALVEQVVLVSGGERKKEDAGRRGCGKLGHHASLWFHCVMP